MREEENYYSDMENTSGEYMENSYDTYNPYTVNQEQPSQSFGIASMILGIASLVLFCSCLNIPLAIVALILGIIQLTKTGSGKGMAITGIVTSVLSVLLFIMFVGLFMLTANVAESNLSNTLEMYEEYEALEDFDIDMDETF